MFPNPQAALPLPFRPDLEQYRKQAKDLVKACKAGAPDAIRDWLSKWMDALVRSQKRQEPVLRQQLNHEFEEILAFISRETVGSRCILANAQFVIARSHGFSSWRKLRDHIHDEVCRLGYNASRQTFVQSYGSTSLDASLLMLPLVGFLPASDPRVQRTVQAIEQDLMEGGLVRRYLPTPEVDGLPPGEGLFLPCSFWLVDAWCLMGEHRKATALFERLLALRNDVGLLAEEYDPHAGRLIGNFPQAFSHVGLVNSAYNLVHRQGPAQNRQAS